MPTRIRCCFPPVRYPLLVLLTLALAVAASAATTVVNDTFANGSSQDQDISNNSLNVFDGACTEGGTA